MKTYSIVAPRSTHFRKGTCEEAGCLAHRRGWRTVVDERLELGQAQAHYIRKVSHRKFTESKGEDGLTTFTFPPGQECFASHTIRIDRPEIYVVRDGDWRGNPRGTAPKRHVRAEDWVEDFALHQGRVNDRLARG